MCPRRRPSPRRRGRSNLWDGGWPPARLWRAGRVAVERSAGCAERRYCGRAPHVAATSGTRVHVIARQHNHHGTSQGGNNGTEPERCVPGMSAQHGRPPAMTGGVVTAHATYEQHADGSFQASPKHPQRPSACIPHAVKAACANVAIASCTKDQNKTFTALPTLCGPPSKSQPVTRTSASVMGSIDGAWAAQRGHGSLFPFPGYEGLLPPGAGHTPLRWQAAAGQN
jgi:hypothetical protein